MLFRAPREPDLRIYDNSTILVIFMEITQNGVDSKKIGGILIFAPRGSSEPIEYATFLYGLE